jgi:XTP/dITP diphosphohydrolase
MRFVLATRNRGKVRELHDILEGLAVELLTMDDLALGSPPETGATFEENALLKARAAVAATGSPALADDSGLEVDALGGAPGVLSARYAGTDGDDEANNRRLIRELDGVPHDARTARFVCAAALVLPDGREWTSRGTMEGHVIDVPRGDAGFGYDPHFVAAGETRTNAELPPDVKNTKSHRGAAFRALRPRVAEVLGEARA